MKSNVTNIKDAYKDKGLISDKLSEIVVDIDSDIASGLGSFRCSLPGYLSFDKGSDKGLFIPITDYTKDNEELFVMQSIRFIERSLSIGEDKVIFLFSHQLVNIFIKKNTKLIRNPEFKITRVQELVMNDPIKGRTSIVNPIGNSITPGLIPRNVEYTDLIFEINPKYIPLLDFSINNLDLLTLVTYPENGFPHE